MPYYTGSANNFEGLRTALFNACVAEGYTLVGTDILTKGTGAVKIENNTVSVSVKGLGLIIQGGLGVSGSSLVSPSPTTPRMGQVSATVNLPTWPMEYQILIHTGPDEVYMTAKYNIDSYYWLAFGISDHPALSATGQWVAANAICREPIGANGVYINASGGTGGNSAGSSCGIFWQTQQFQTSTYYLNESTIATGLDSINWAGNPTGGGVKAVGTVDAVDLVTNMVSVTPNAWNSESPLLPITVLQWRAANKCSVVANLRHARYCRVDNYTPGQIISLGLDKWVVQPFYRKNSTVRNGGSNIDHTGTFGWAIRYDGP